MPDAKTAITERCKSQDIQDFKPYSVYDKDNNEYIIDNIHYGQYKNGAIVDLKQNRSAIVAMDVQGHHITKETASEYANKYWQDARIASQAAIARAARQKTGLKGWEEIVYNQALIALSKDSKDQDRINAARFVGKVSGYTPSNVDIIKDREDLPESDNILVSLPKDALLQLANFLRAHKEDSKQDIIDM